MRSWRPRPPICSLFLGHKPLIEGVGNKDEALKVVRLTPGAQPEELVVWGTGRATREHLYVEDAAEGLLALARWGQPDPINIGTGEEVSVADLARAVAKATGFVGPIRFDETKPDGQPRKVMDCAKAKRVLKWTSRVSLEEGLTRTVAWYREALSC